MVSERRPSRVAIGLDPGYLPAALDGERRAAAAQHEKQRRQLRASLRAALDEALVEAADEAMLGGAQHQRPASRLRRRLRRRLCGMSRERPCRSPPPSSPA